MIKDYSPNLLLEAKEKLKLLHPHTSASWRPLSMKELQQLLTLLHECRPELLPDLAAALTAREIEGLAD